MSHVYLRSYKVNNKLGLSSKDIKLRARPPNYELAVPSVSIGEVNSCWNADDPHGNETLNILALGKMNWLRLAALKRDELIVTAVARVYYKVKDV